MNGGFINSVYIYPALNVIYWNYFKTDILARVYKCTLVFGTPAAPFVLALYQRLLNRFWMALV